MVIFNKTEHQKLWEHLGDHPNFSISEGIENLGLSESHVHCCKVASQLAKKFRFVRNKCSLCPLELGVPCVYLTWDSLDLGDRASAVTYVLSRKLNPLLVDELTIL